MSDVIDLDALQPKATIIKFNGKEITLSSPNTGDVLRLGEAAQRLQSVAGDDEATIDKVVGEVTDRIYKIIPGLVGEALNTAQLLVLISAISYMAIPPDAKELQKRGITVGDADPKAP